MRQLPFTLWAAHLVSFHGVIFVKTSLARLGFAIKSPIGYTGLKLRDPEAQYPMNLVPFPTALSQSLNPFSLLITSLSGMTINRQSSLFNVTQVLWNSDEARNNRKHAYMKGWP